MENEYKEYTTFTTTTRTGEEVEMAVVDEFEFEEKYYVVGALIKDEEIQTDGQYIYRCIPSEDDFTVEKIFPVTEYNRVAKAYMDMED